MNFLRKNKIIYRLARPEDLKTLNRLSFESKRHWGYPEEWMIRWKKELTISETDIESKNILLVQSGQKVIGFCQIEEREEIHEILHLWLLPKYIGKGFGKSLLDEALKQLAGVHKTVMVVADPNAEAFYKKQGFLTVDQLESYPKGRFLPVMRKELS